MMNDTVKVQVPKNLQESIPSEISKAEVRKVEKENNVKLKSRDDGTMAVHQLFSG